MPYDADRLSVDSDFCKVLDLSEVDPELCPWREPALLGIDGLRVSAEAAEVADAQVRVVVPLSQVLSSQIHSYKSD